MRSILAEIFVRNLEMVKMVLNLSLNAFVGGFGLLLVVHGFLEVLSGQSYLPNVFVKKLSSTVTIFSTMLVAFLIYFRMHQREPTEISKFVSAPLTIFIGAVMLLFLLKGWPLPEGMLIGFAMMGLHGGIARALPFTELREVRKRSTS